MRVLIAFFMLTFMVTSSVAAPVALCRHGGEAGHAAALASNDAAIAAAAHNEDAAAATADKKASLADGGVLSGVLVADMPFPVDRSIGAEPSWPVTSSDPLAGVGPDLLLDPPIA